MMMFLALVLSRVFALTPQPLDVSGDGGVIKTVLQDGTGPKPQPRQEATINYIGYLSDGSVFDTSRDRGEFRFTLGQGVIPGWSIGVASMKVGEVANFTMKYGYGYGERGYPPIVPAKADLKYQIELLKVQSTDVWPS
jgi:FKBP-type peptidyl-prolyl cis-trans isomerase